MKEDDERDKELLDALLAALPRHISHLPARLVANDLSVLIDAWKAVREVPASDPDRRSYFGSLVSDIVLIDELVGRVMKFRSERLWWLSLPDRHPLAGDGDGGLRRALDVLDKVPRVQPDEGDELPVKKEEKGGD